VNQPAVLAQAGRSHQGGQSVPLTRRVPGYWPAYFSAIDRALAPGGRAGLQAITMPHDRLYLAYSEAGFRSGYLNVRQLLLERTRR